MPPSIIVVLGYACDKAGRLATISKERANKGIEHFGLHTRSQFILTGGFGARFNTSAHPLATHLRNYLIAEGFALDDILAEVPSRYTLEDATMTKAVVDNLGACQLTVVTSPAHMIRARYLFEKTFAGSPHTLAFKDAPPTTLGSWLLNALFTIREAAYLHQLKQADEPQKTP